MTRTAVAAVLLAAFASAGLTAHHSFAAYYFEERSVSIEGEVVEFQYVAPHAWVHLMALDSGGQLQRFAAEWSNPTRLARDGVSRDTLKAGDRVVITGSPGRKPSEYKMHLNRIERPSDGWRWRSSNRRR